MRQYLNLRPLVQKLNSPISVIPLVYFRIAFGLIMFIEMIRYFNKGWIERYFIEPQMFFTYEGFHWVSPLEGNNMYVYFALLLVLTVFITLGLFYRISIILFFLGFTYIFLLDKTNYLNHFYFISLISFILIWLPANAKYSIDKYLFPTISSNVQPFWSLMILRFQIGLVYFFGGIAKLNSDWLNAEPMRMWLSRRTDFPVIGFLFTKEWMINLMSFGGLFLDLLGPLALLYRKTRLLAVISFFTFHILNSQLFTIGIFPWFMIAATLLFFPPSIFTNKNTNLSIQSVASFNTSKTFLAYGLGLYMLIQILIPLRHFLYPGNVNWTEEGHRFSWHMKLRSKSSKSTFYAVYENDTIIINPSDFLTSRQLKKFDKKPDMIWQFAQYFKHLNEQYNENEVKVYADIKASLNGREYQQYINPNINLLSVDYSIFKHLNWVTPLTVPLHDRRSKYEYDDD